MFSDMRLMWRQGGGGYGIPKAQRWGTITTTEGGGITQKSGTYQVKQKSAGNTKTLIDLERVIQLGVINQTLPADGCPGLLKVHSHDDSQVL